MMLLDCLKFINNSNDNMRNLGEETIQKLEKEHLNFFFEELLSIIIDSSLPNNLRNLSILILKNSLSSNFEGIFVINNNKWIKTDSIIRNNIKIKLINLLQKRENEIKKSIAQLFSRILLIEIYNQHWKFPFKDLYYFLESNNFNLNLYESILEIITFFFQEVNNDEIYLNLIKIESNIIFKTIFFVLKSSEDGIISLKLSALNCLNHGLNFLKSFIENNNQIDDLIKLTINQIIVFNTKHKIIIIEILEKLVNTFYTKIDNYIEIIINFSLYEFENINDENLMKIIDFWSSIAEKEFELNLSNVLAFNEGRIPEIYVKHYVKKAKNKLLKEIVKLIQYSKSFYDFEEWNLYSNSAICLNYMIQASPGNLVPIFLKSFKEHRKINYFKKYNQNDIVIFIATLDGIGAKFLYEEVFFFNKYWLSIFNTNSFEFQNSVLLILIRILSISSIYLRNDLDKIFKILNDTIYKKNFVENFFILLNLFIISFEKEGVIDNQISNMFPSLLKIIYNQHLKDYRADLIFEIICSIVLTSNLRLMMSISYTLPILLKIINNGFLVNYGIKNSFSLRIQTNHFRIISCFLQKIGKKLNKIFILEFNNILKKSYNFQDEESLKQIDEEILVSLATISQILKYNFKHEISFWIPIVFKILSLTENDNILSVSVGIICDFISVGLNDNLDNELFKLISNKYKIIEKKPRILSLFSDIFLLNGKKYVENLNNNLLFLRELIYLYFDTFNKKNADIEWFLDFQDGMIELITALFQSLYKYELKNVESLFKIIFLEMIKFIRSLVVNNRLNSTIKGIIGLIGDIRLTFKEFSKNLIGKSWIFQLIIESKLSTEFSFRNIGLWIKPILLSKNY
ncbi:importin beta-1 SU [Guillardia theta]|uniref:Importin beta-1 SU n=1 Tax=Guillardia theta TaxID=55529 RepID=Q9AW68_GUITH|nr:importin beta-1 SU [Guillardia theta]CAC27002.1 importin beta-1 SU [Guillardia theta]